LGADKAETSVVEAGFRMNTSLVCMPSYLFIMSREIVGGYITQVFRVRQIVYLKALL